eukprot:1446173-Pyramimonas_sp.AAC.1
MMSRPRACPDPLSCARGEGARGGGQPLSLSPPPLPPLPLLPPPPAPWGGRPSLARSPRCSLAPG